MKLLFTGFSFCSKKLGHHQNKRVVFSGESFNVGCHLACLFAQLVVVKGMHVPALAQGAVALSPAV